MLKYDETCPVAPELDLRLLLNHALLQLLELLLQHFSLFLFNQAAAAAFHALMPLAPIFLVQGWCRLSDR